MTATMTAPSPLAARVYQVLARHSGLPANAFTADTSLEGAGIDSLGMIEALFDLETTFGVTIPDTGDATDRFRDFLTAGGTARLIESLLAQQAA